MELIDNVSRRHKFRQNEIIQQYKTLIQQIGTKQSKKRKY